MIHLYAIFHLNGFRPTLRCFVFDAREGQELSQQFDTQVNFAGKHDHNNRTAESAFSDPWNFSEMELEPVAG